jgi:hypothetical protein
MNYKKITNWVSVFLLASAFSPQLPAQDSGAPKTGDKTAAGQPNEAQMMAQMMELAKPGENHKLLEGLVGSWTYRTKYWMSPDPAAPPGESFGTTVTKAIMGGRYFQSDHSGKFQMPGSDGKPMDMEFTGQETTGYDNAKKKFVSTWLDNMGTGIMNSEGTYDAESKTFTYTGDYEPVPGMKTKVREVLKIIDQDHHTFEFYEDRGSRQVKTMEISYTRAK